MSLDNPDVQRPIDIFGQRLSSFPRKPLFIIGGELANQSAGILPRKFFRLFSSPAMLDTFVILTWHNPEGLFIMLNHPPERL